MSTIKIKYVGVKESEDAFRDLTNLIWFQGSVHDVPVNVAVRMLKHPDVFARAEAAPVAFQATAPAPAPTPAAVLVGGDGKPTPASIAHAKALLAAAGLAVVDPTTPQAPALNDVALSQATGTNQATGADFGQSDKALATSPVQETQTGNPPGADGLQLAPGGVIGGGDNAGAGGANVGQNAAATAQGTASPPPAPAAAKTAAKTANGKK